MKKRTKKYNPASHRINAYAVADTIRLAKPVPADSADRLNAQIHAALEAITKGIGQPVHFDALASTVDLVFMMDMNLFQDAYADDIKQARQAMFRLKDRFYKHGVFGFDGEGYNAIKQLIVIHDELIKNVTGAEVLQFMKARASAIRSGNFHRSDIERLAA
jgi:glutamate-1-semialdehyde aminotransferase